MAITKKSKTANALGVFFGDNNMSSISTAFDVGTSASKASGTKTKNKRTAGSGNVVPDVNAVGTAIASTFASVARAPKPTKTEINIIKMPKVGNYTKAFLSKWRIAVGDRISEGDVIADFEMGWEAKAYQSRFTGEVLALFVNECDFIYEGKPICVLKCEVECEDNPENAAETGFAILLIGIRDKCKGKVVECLKNIMGISTAKADGYTFGIHEYGNRNLAKALMTGISRDLANVYAQQLAEAGANVKVVVAGNVKFMTH